MAVALAECCIAGGLGATVALDDGLPAVSSLFSETQSRILVSVAEADTAVFIERLIAAEVPYSVIGEVGGDTLAIEGVAPLAVEGIAGLYNTALEAQVTQR